jgi:hypothetical protein
MRTKFAAILAPALALGVLAVTAEAQQHRATRLGNPATRFAKPLTKTDDLRVLLRSDTMKADVGAILKEVGWKGNLEDVERAAAAAEISVHPGPDRDAPPLHGVAEERETARARGRALGGSEADRRVRVRVLLELRPLPPRHSQGVQQLLDRGPGQGHRRPEVHDRPLRQS